MAKLSIKAGSTDVTLLVWAQDSSSTTGGGKTGLAYNTSGLTCYCARPGVAAAAISLVTQTVTGAHADGGFVEVDATNMPGLYRLDLPDAVCAAGVRSAVVLLKGATNLAPLTLEIDLSAEAASVAGDVGGKVLGGGSGTITGTGARVVDASGNAVAPASDVTSILADTASLNDTVLAEITGAASIPATPTIRQAIMLLYMAVRNGCQATATERRIVNDAGTEVLDATMSDNGTTFDQGKLGDA